MMLNRNSASSDRNLGQRQKDPLLSEFKVFKAKIGRYQKGCPFPNSRFLRRKLGNFRRGTPFRIQDFSGENWAISKGAPLFEFRIFKAKIGRFQKGIQEFWVRNWGF